MATNGPDYFPKILSWNNLQWLNFFPKCWFVFKVSWTFYITHTHTLSYIHTHTHTHTQTHIHTHTHSCVLTRVESKGQNAELLTAISIQRPFLLQIQVSWPQGRQSCGPIIPRYWQCCWRHHQAAAATLTAGSGSLCLFIYFFHWNISDLEFLLWLSGNESD